MFLDLFVLGIFMIIIGALIWRYTLVNWIAGYSKKKTKNKQGLAKWIGTNIILMGVLTLLISILDYLLNLRFGLIIGLVVIIVVLSIRTNFGSKDYEK